MVHDAYLVWFSCFNWLPSLKLLFLHFDFSGHILLQLSASGPFRFRFWRWVCWWRWLASNLGLFWGEIITRSMFYTWRKVGKNGVIPDIGQIWAAWNILLTMCMTTSHLWCCISLINKCDTLLWKFFWLEQLSEISIVFILILNWCTALLAYLGFASKLTASSSWEKNYYY